MARKITVVLSQGQSASPDKRKLEEDLVAGLLFERGLEVTVIPHLYDLTPDGTGDALPVEASPATWSILSWLYPRAHIGRLNRNGIKGQFGATLLKSPAEDGDEDEDEEDADAAAMDESEADEADKPRLGPGDVPNRTIYHLDLRWYGQAAPYLDEIKRIAREKTVETVDLMGWIQGSPAPEQMARYLNPGNGKRLLTNRQATRAAATAITPPTARRAAGRFSCRTSRCGSTKRPLGAGIRSSTTAAARTAWSASIFACSASTASIGRRRSWSSSRTIAARAARRAAASVPENAIIFPQHKSPAIAGSPDENAGGLKIDLSLLFGRPQRHRSRRPGARRGAGRRRPRRGRPHGRHPQAPRGQSGRPQGRPGQPDGPARRLF